MFVPFNQDRDFILRGLGVDNGSEYLGVAVIDHDLRTGVSTVIYAYTYRPAKIAYERYPHLVESRGSFYARVKAVKDIIGELLEDWDPDLVACESPFSHLHVQSYAVLLTTINAIDDVVYAYRSTLPFLKVPPGKAKKTACTGFKYGTDKDHIRDCILKTPTIVAGEGIVLEELEEDSMDAVTVGRHGVLEFSDW